MKNTLVIHPFDPSTHFLHKIYEGRGWTVISHYIPRINLIKQIKKYDRIIMLGHGTPNGLLGHGGYVIDYSYMDLLSTKECIIMWCNADRYVSDSNIKGFYTGMIISELEEAYYCNVDATMDDINESNILLTEGFRLHIDSNEFAKELKNFYTSKTNKVIQFNNERIYNRKAYAANI